MNRFAKFVFAGGTVLVVGLWILELEASWGPLWRVGLLAVLVGASGLVYGIFTGLGRGPGLRDR